MPFSSQFCVPILEWPDRGPEEENAAGATPADGPRSHEMTTITGAKPHPIFLAGRWVESPDPLVIENPANPSEPAGSTFTATGAQYEEAVDAAVKAFEVTRNL